VHVEQRSGGRSTLDEHDERRSGPPADHSVILPDGPGRVKSGAASTCSPWLARCRA
jgi:hypothetical protein